MSQIDKKIETIYKKSKFFSLIFYAPTKLSRLLLISAGNVLSTPPIETVTFRICASPLGRMWSYSRKHVLWFCFVSIWSCCVFLQLKLYPIVSYPSCLLSWCPTSADCCVIVASFRITSLLIAVRWNMINSGHLIAVNDGQLHAKWRLSMK